MKIALACLILTIALYVCGCAKNITTPVDTEAAKAMESLIAQAEIREHEAKANVESYIQNGYFTKADTPPDVFVTDKFYNLLFQDKEIQLKELATYYASLSEETSLGVSLRDWKTGDDVGYYSDGSLYMYNNILDDFESRLEELEANAER
jgi:hypothetical protein